MSDHVEVSGYFVCAVACAHAFLIDLLPTCRRHLGHDWCWAEKACTGVVDYFCGDFRGKALKVPTDSGVEVEVDGCELCLNHYVWRTPPIYVSTKRA